jgi:hypothetical protein
VIIVIITIEEKKSTHIKHAPASASLAFLTNPYKHPSNMTDSVAAILPTLTTPADCTSFSKTVLPYLHQLSLTHLLPLLCGEISPKEWYLATNPVISAILFALFISLVVFISAEINRNCSQVDRLWSILPALYTGHFALWSHLHGIGSERVDTLATLVALWSVCSPPP